jgi:Phytanoyl-CoA dioxygenase (PhyH)
VERAATDASLSDRVREGDVLDAIEELTLANRIAADPERERRLARLRYEAFADLEKQPGFATWPPPTDLDPQRPIGTIPEVELRDLDGEVLRRNLLGHGCVRIPQLLDDAKVAEFVAGIEHALEAVESGPGSEMQRTTSWYASLALSREEAQSLGRHWVYGSGGLLTADSPKLLNLLLETFTELGLREIIGDYLGERPVLSANKCTLRRVKLTAGTDWHQDGAFLGRGIRSLNVWIALNDCGIDSPGLDLLPRRFDDIVETGTGGAIFDWAVGPQVVERLAVETPVLRPVFRAGDAMLFDDLFLHRTAVEPTMTRPRYALETWCFAPSVYPEGQVPIVW